MEWPSMKKAPDRRSAEREAILAIPRTFGLINRVRRGVPVPALRTDFVEARGSHRA
jgi:hypothetical protein